MNIKIEKKNLLEAVGIVSRFAQSKNTSLPSLTGILIIAGNDGIKLRATNLETAIDFEVPGTIEEEGVVVVPAHTLREISSSLDGKGSVSLSTKEDSVTIRSDMGVSILRTLPSEDFPILPSISNSVSSFSVTTEELQSFSQTVLPYASQSTVRPELASVFFNNSGGTLTLVATDSFRLAEKKITLSKNTTPFSFLIPAKNLSLVLQSLPQGEVEVVVDEHQCIFRFPSGTITSRLTQGNYPDYKQIIPKTFISEATMLKKDFENALKRTAIFSDLFQKITITTKPETKETLLSAKNNDIGQSEERIACSITGEEVQISFNHRYLTAPLGALQNDTIQLSISGMGRAAILRGMNDSSFLYLVMPMNQ